MKIIFMGTPSIARVMLEALDKQHEIIAVISQSDKNVGRKKQIVYSPVKQYAIDHELTILQPIKINDIIEEIKQYPCDLIVTCAYGQKIPDEILTFPKFGSINVHASLLPQYRGGAPIHRCIINGEKESGISIMRMIDRLDAGSVMSQVKVSIEDDDTMGSLYDKLAQAGAKLLNESIDLIKQNKAIFVEQDESKASFASIITKEDEFINFEQDVKVVYNHCRGLIPAPCGYALMNNKKVKFHQVAYEYATHQHDAGKVLGLCDQGIKVACLHGYLYLKQLQLEGKKQMDAKSFYMGVGKSWNQSCFNR